MADRTKTHVLGPGTLTLDGTDVGYISAPKLKLSFTEVESTTAAYGDTPIDTFRIAEKAELTVLFDEIGFQNYQKAIQGATRNTSGSDEDISLGSFAGTRMTAMELLYTPRNSAISATHAMKMWRVVPVSDREVSFDIDKTQKLEVTFRALIDESKTDGEKLLRFGNVSVSADTTAPTISSSSPTDGATGVSTTAAKTITFSEQLNPSTVNTGTVLIVASTETSTSTPIACTVSLDSTGLIVSITPNSALASTTEYELITTPGIKNASNIAFAGDKRSFTTT